MIFFTSPCQNDSRIDPGRQILHLKAPKWRVPHQNGLEALISPDRGENMEETTALKHSRDFLSQIVSSLGGGLLVLDTQLTILFANPVMVQSLPPPRRSLIGKKCYEAIHEKDQPCASCPCRETLRTGGKNERVVFHQDPLWGKSGWFLHLSWPLLDPETKELKGVIEYIQDISEQKKIEEALRLSQAKWNTLVENLADGYYEVNLRGDLVFFNQPLAQIFGYPAEELLGMNNREYTDAENAKKMFQAFNRVYRTGQPLRGLRFEILTKEKTRRHLELSVSLKKDDQGKAVGFTGIARDITDLIRIQEELKAGEERYRNVIETINDAYFETDLKGNLTFINQSFLDQFARPQEEFLGLNYREFTDEENARLLFQAFHEVYRTGRPARGIRHEVISRGRKIGTFEVSVSAIRDASGDIMGFRGISRNISDLIEIQKALQDSEERYRTIVETMQEGYYENDLAGNLTFVNQAMADFLGYSKEEMIGMNYRDYTPAESQKAVLEGFKELYRTGKTKTLHYEMRHKDGKTRMIETTPAIIKNASGEAVGFRGTSRDITDLIETQKELENSEKRFRIAAECASDMIYEVDVATGNLFWFGNSLDKLEKMIGCVPQTVAEFEKHVHPEDNPKRREAVRLHLKGGQPYRHEYRIRGKNGEIFYVRGAAKGLRNEKGWVYRWIGAFSDITEQKKREEELRTSLTQLHKAMGGIIQAMALTVESKDPYTAGHQQRVSHLARAIAQEMGLAKDQIEAVRMAGVVHDLGKISVPAEILSKPTELTDLEFKLIQAHPQTSYDILKDIDFPWPVARIVLQHHERLDGSGYPFGLKGDQILLEAQILMVADVVEAIASHRPYRPAFGIEQALMEIDKNKGSKYNSQVVEVCLRLFREKGFSFDEPFNYQRRS